VAEAFREEQDVAEDSEEPPHSTAVEQVNDRLAAGVNQTTAVSSSSRHEAFYYYSDVSGLRGIHGSGDSDSHPFWFDSTNPLGITVAASLSDFMDDSMCDSTSSASIFISFSQSVFDFTSHAGDSC
jgi:hypothetical protein